MRTISSKPFFKFVWIGTIKILSYLDHTPVYFKTVELLLVNFLAMCNRPRKGRPSLRVLR
jgi:hypothetical protein